MSAINFKCLFIFLYSGYFSVLEDKAYNHPLSLY